MRQFKKRKILKALYNQKDVTDFHPLNTNERPRSDVSEIKKE